MKISLTFNCTVDTILYAGGLEADEEPTSTKRGQVFSDDELNELEMLLVYLQLIGMGRFFHYYGDANGDGEKADCLIRYQNVTLDAGDFNTVMGTGVLDLGSCTAANFNVDGVGRADLGTQGDYNIKRLCHGAMIINNFFHVFPSLLARISGADFDNVASMENVLTLITQFMETQKAGVSDKVSNVLSQTRCETLNKDDDDFLQVYYLFLMEKVFYEKLYFSPCIYFSVNCFSQALKSPVARLVGNAYTSRALDNYSLFYNPAAIGH